MDNIKSVHACKICHDILERGQEVMSHQNGSKTHHYCKSCYADLWI